MIKTLPVWRGELRAVFRGGDAERFLNACADAGLTLRELESGTEGLRFCLYEDEWERACKIALLCSGELERLSLRGGSAARGVFTRRARLGVLAALCALALSLSGLFIWDFEVVGNETLSDTAVLRALAACGVSEGCFWPATDAETIRSGMLLRMPELAWMSLNVKGSRATVVVLERREKPEIYDESAPADLTAAKDGVIADYSVQNGRTLIARGETVTAGQTLVSGTMDSPAGGMRRVRAKGSVTAETWPEKTVFLCPGAREKRTGKGFRLALSLCVGRSRLNLSRNSRKELDECDKIVKEYSLGVKGLFRFPLRLVAELSRPCETAGPYRPDTAAFRRRALAALEAETKGELLSCEITEEAGALRLKAHCLENIARTEER